MRNCCYCSLYLGCLVVASLGLLGSIVAIGLGSLLVQADSSVMGILLISDGGLHLLASIMLITGTLLAKRQLLVFWIVTVSEASRIAT